MHGDATTSASADQPHLLDDLVASIRASVAPGVTAEGRAAGVAMRQAIVTALQMQSGQPTTAAPAATSPASLLLRLAAMPQSELIELVKQLPGGRP
jgi:hypothetical protein